MGENPLLSEPNLAHVREAFASLELLVVQDIFPTETTELAHVVLPGASFAEKDGTFTNTERRVQRVRKAVEPAGQSRPDWQIVCALASRMGAAGFDYHNAKQIMHEIKDLAPIYGGVSHESLEQLSLQWPCPEHGHPGTPVLHSERFSRGLGRFMPIDYVPSAESTDEAYPLLLTTGRNLYQFHTGTMTRRVKGLSKRLGEEKMEINPRDAAALGVADGETVKISSRRGSLNVKVRVTDVTPPGVVYMTFHFCESPVNLLTGAGRDPTANTPDYKVSAVRVEKLAEATHV
jgi:predicted molibdopterin-dependent oxidoreductase YjgC